MVAPMTNDQKEKGAVVVSGGGGHPEAYLQVFQAPVRPRVRHCGVHAVVVSLILFEHIPPSPFFVNPGRIMPL